METMLTSLQIIGLILGISAIGYYIVARDVVPMQLIRLLNLLATDVALPLFIFTVFMADFSSEGNKGWWLMPVWWILFTGLTFILVLLFSRFFSREVRIESSLALFLNNPHFIPISVIVGVYGIHSSHLVNLFLFTVFTISLYFSCYTIFFRRSKLLFDVQQNLHSGSQGMGKAKEGFDFKKLFNPVVKATILVLIIKLAGFSAYVPDVVLSVTDQVGNMTFPLLMIIVGGSIYIDMKNLGKIYVFPIIKFIIVKNVFFPVLILMLLYVFRPSFDIALILLLEAASPPLSTVPSLVARQKGNAEIANQFVVSSFFASVVSIPVMLYLLNLLYA